MTPEEINAEMLRVLQVVEGRLSLDEDKPGPQVGRALLPDIRQAIRNAGGVVLSEDRQQWRDKKAAERKSSPNPNRNNKMKATIKNDGTKEATTVEADGATELEQALRSIIADDHGSDDGWKVEPCDDGQGGQTSLQAEHPDHPGVGYVADFAMTE